MPGNYERTGQHLVVPTAGRYAEQINNTARAVLRPIGGFNSTDGAIAALHSELSSASRLAALEQSLSNARLGNASAEQRMRSLMQGDSLQMRRNQFNEQQRQQHAGIVGTLAFGAKAVEGVYNIAREVQGDGQQGTAKHIADFLGKFAPSAEKAYQAKLKADAADKKLQAAIDANKTLGDNYDNLIKDYRESQKRLGIFIGGLLRDHSEDFVQYSDIFDGLTGLIGDLFGPRDGGASDLPSHSPGTQVGSY